MDDLKNIKSGYATDYTKKNGVDLSKKIPSSPSSSSYSLDRAKETYETYRKMVEDGKQDWVKNLKLQGRVKKDDTELSSVKNYYHKRGEEERYWDKNHVESVKGNRTKKHWEDKRDYICPCGASLVTYIRTYKYTQSRVANTRSIHCECDKSSYVLYSPPFLE